MSTLAETIEGRIELGLSVDRGGTVAAVAIRSSRQVRAAGLLQGRTVQQAVDALPLLFSICGTAQRHAALTACETALGIDLPAAQGVARDLLLLGETAREHAWRILLDWPPLIGLPPDPPALRALRGGLSGLGGALYPARDMNLVGGGGLQPDRAAVAQAVDRLADQIRRAVLGEPAADGSDPPVWTEPAAFEHWCAAGGSPAAQVLRFVLDEGLAGFGGNGIGDLPVLDAAEIEAVLGSPTGDRFAEAPRWRDRPCLTGPLARRDGQPLIAALRARHGNGLLPLLAARLIELLEVPARMRALLPRLGEDPGRTSSPDSPLPEREGTGLAMIEMARGRLIHRVMLGRGRMTRYQIVAPTEWNFHPAGALAEGLAGAPVASADRLRQTARFLAMALDPCVACDIAIGDGGGRSGNDA